MGRMLKRLTGCRRGDRCKRWPSPLSILLFLVSCCLANHNRWWSCNEECKRCVRRVTPTETLIEQFYPGLFSQTPPENIFVSPEMTNLGSDTVDSATAEIPGQLNRDTVNQSVNRSPDNPAVWVVASSGRVGQTQGRASGCCETVTEYVTPPNVTIRGQVFPVVHLRHAFQFIPIGKCRQGSTCTQGECVEQYRAHWVLIYNDSNQAPPVSFSPMEVPSHCECLNVGRP